MDRSAKSSGSSGADSHSADGEAIGGGDPFWPSRYRRQINQEQRREIGQNLAGFFQLLAEWEGKIEPGEVER